MDNTLSSKKNIIIGVMTLFAIVLIVRLFVIQILDPSYKVTASNNVLRYEVQYPARGLIYDRNGKLLVENRTAYDINVVARELVAFDTTEFCNIFNLSKASFKETIDDIYRRRRSLGYQAVILLKQMPAEYYAVFQEKAFKFPGFYAQARTLRMYPRNLAGNMLGYVAEVDTGTIRKNPYYKMGDYMGKSGVEYAYEEALRGTKGVSIYVRDAHNQIKNSYMDGEYDSSAVAGKNLICTIDSDLQEYGERLMSNKAGAVVALEPSTGEILAMVSSPGIDPRLLVGINRNFQQMQLDPYKPLFNRAMMSPYPPGSVFKVCNALIGLQEGVVRPETRYGCSMGYHIGGLTVGCHAHPSPLDLRQSIQMSCNAYYCAEFRSIIDNPKYGNVQEAFEKWREYVKSFGFGTKLGTDYPNELAGSLPSVAGYDRLHGKGRWKSASIISLSIGQGEMGATPMHLANFAATIANRGYYYMPHMVKTVGDSSIAGKYTKRHYTMVDSSYFNVIIDGMDLAVNGGAGSTGGRARIPGITVCGKTGTAQNPHGVHKEDHAVFICFAPRDNPKIAIAVYVENAGFGGTWAAPIASLMMEKYLQGEVDPQRLWLEEFVLSGDLLKNIKIKK